MSYTVNGDGMTIFLQALSGSMVVLAGMTWYNHKMLKGSKKMASSGNSLNALLTQAEARAGNPGEVPTA